MRRWFWHLADSVMTLLHLAVVLIVILGWIPPDFRSFHRWCVLVTALSWFGLGIPFGFGYCALTDIQWRIKRKLGIAPEYEAFVPFILRKIGIDAKPQLIDKVTQAAFALVILITLGLMVRSPA